MAPTEVGVCIFCMIMALSGRLTCDHKFFLLSVARWPRLLVPIMKMGEAIADLAHSPDTRGLSSARCSGLPAKSKSAVQVLRCCANVLFYCATNTDPNKCYNALSLLTVAFYHFSPLSLAGDGAGFPREGVPLRPPDWRIGTIICRQKPRLYSPATV
jgi:hypothetical protein